MAKKLSEKSGGTLISGDVSRADLEKYQGQLEHIAGQLKGFQLGLDGIEQDAVHIRGWKKIERGLEIVLSWCDNVDAAIHIESRRLARGDA
jgi:hypothetical protein